MKVKKLHPQAIIPQRIKENDGGIDLYALVDTIIPNNINNIIGNKKVRTGIAIELPSNHVGLVLGRSGLAFNQGIHAFIGTIDSNYRGEIGVLLYNMNNTPFHIKAGDRIGQLLIMEYKQFAIVESDTLTETERGDLGYGSSGR